MNSTEPFPVWARHFADGAANPGSPWRNLALGTIGLDHAPQVRTVVLRRFCGRALDIHTDTRSAKFGELGANPAATLHGWDSAGRIQLRASGLVALHVADSVAEAAWALLHERSRATYRVQPGPGTVLSAPDNAAPDDVADGMPGVFCVVRLTIHRLDWLHLAEGGHRRACFIWTQGGILAKWLVP